MAVKKKTWTHIIFKDTYPVYIPYMLPCIHSTSHYQLLLLLTKMNTKKDKSAIQRSFDDMRKKREKEKEKDPKSTEKNQIIDIDSDNSSDSRKRKSDAEKNDQGEKKIKTELPKPKPTLNTTPELTK